jgi:hypothetical protein
MLSALRLGRDWSVGSFAVGSHQPPTLCKSGLLTVFVIAFTELVLQYNISGIYCQALIFADCLFLS